MKKFLILLLFLFNFSWAVESNFHKYDINESKKINSIKEVYYFFWNFCEDCKKLNKELPEFIQYLNRKNIKFKKFPVFINNEAFDKVARYYISLEEYGNHKLKEKFFFEMYDKKEKNITYREFRTFLKKNLDRKEIIKVLKLTNSSIVNNKIKSIKEVQEKNKIFYVPTILIEEKFLINGNLSGSDEIILKESLKVINSYDSN